MKLLKLKHWRVRTGGPNRTFVVSAAKVGFEPFMSNAAQSLNDRYDRKGMIAQG
jgi:hypothetical protein